MQPYQTLVNSSFSRYKILKIRYFILLIFLSLFSLNSYSQSITKGIGYIGDDYVLDMVSHNGVNYLFGTMGSAIDSNFYIGDNLVKLNCIGPAVIAFDDSLNVIKTYCFDDPYLMSSTVFFEKGRILYDTITNSIIIGASFGGTIVFGSDTLSTGNNQQYGFFVAKLDTNLNALWGVSSDCNTYSNAVYAYLNDIALDKDGKVFAAVQADQKAEKLCFGNDSIITMGRINIDTNGNVEVSKVVPSLNLLNKNIHFLKMLDDYKLLEIYYNKMQMVDTRYDTIIWQKNIGYSPNARFLAVDKKHQSFYLIHNTNFDQLKKYDFDGNLIWQKSISDLKEPLGIDVTADGKKVYLSGFSNNSRHKIYVVDSSGNYLESTNWANDLQWGN